MRLWKLWIGLAAVTTALGLGVPQRAAACQCSSTPIYFSDPADGAKDVALNQAIMVEGVFRASSVRLEDESGNPVAFELIAGPVPGCGGTAADVLPTAPLAPNKRYTIRVEPFNPQAPGSELPSTFSFTTGTTMLPDAALEPPSGMASVTFDVPPDTLCGFGATAYTCLDVDGDPGGLEVILRRGEEVLMRMTTVVQDYGLYGLPRAPDCVELRRRAPTGKRSEPFKICGDALHARPWDRSKSTGAFFTCRDGVLTPDFAGMATPPTGTTPANRGAPDAGTPVGPRATAGTASSIAGSPANSNPQPSAADAADHRSYGCAVASGDASGAGAFALLASLLFMLQRARVCKKKRDSSTPSCRSKGR